MKEKNDKLNDKIKNSFGQMNKKAPDLLWNDLSASLDENSPVDAAPESEESYLFQKIKESYSSQHHIAPSHVWQSINKQLNIDLVWTRVSKELDRTGGISWHKWQWTAVAAMFLFMVGIAGAYYLNSEDTKTLLVRDSETSILLADTLARESLATGFGVKKNNENTSATTEEQQSPQLGNISENLSEHQVNQQQEESPFHEDEDASKVSLKSVTGVHENILEHEASTLPSTDNSLASLGSISKSTPSDLLKTRTVIPDPLNKGIYAAFDSLGFRPMAEVQNNATEEYEKKPIILSRLNLGLTLSYNNSWLLNNETQRSFDRGSLISSSPTFKESIGLTLGYHLSSKSIISAEVHLAKNGQEYKTFGDGSYIRKGLELTYYKGYVQYQYNLLQNRKSLLSDITVKAGLFGGFLYDKQGELRETQSRYSQYDYGVRGALGQEKRIGGLTVGYGISVERGLRNIFLGSENMPARFNETYTLNVGPYLNLRFNP
ncbi:hypothetical protein ABID22_002203 [Pontibacter aydingkolensis]|uniref:Outer membrane protein beta-barrel domain-containing protein n=1 Tax=Pontibacter aydingkolensis TaxID=1911536 RepID=A0ABS7CVI2_9BACT|nr:hypothetical protein [Pontibacter aydingkolensis]MBW7467810.1 hypothetical protein [Pontibacter aydingkolensis]